MYSTARCRIDLHTRKVVRRMFREHFGSCKIYEECCHMSITWFDPKAFPAFEKAIRSYQFPYPLRGRGVWMRKHTRWKNYTRVTVSFKIPKDVEE